MSPKWSLAAVAVVIVGVALFQLNRETPALEEPMEPVSRTVPDEPKPVTEPGLEPNSEAPSRRSEAELQAPAEEQEAATAAPAASTPVTGRVVDGAGHGVAGARLRFSDRNGLRIDGEWIHIGNKSVHLEAEVLESLAEHPELLDPFFEGSPNRQEILAMLNSEDPQAWGTTLVESGADGRFTGTLSFAEYDVVLENDDLHMIGSGNHKDAQGRMEMIYVAVHFAPVAGRVLDASGAAAAGVALRAILTLDGLRGFPYALDQDQSYKSWTLESTGSNGHFRHAGLPVAPGLVLRASTGDRGHVEVEVEQTGRQNLELRLRKWSKEDPYLVSGRVLGPEGLTVSGASVMFGQYEDKTDSDGLFALEVGYLRDHYVLIAVQPGHQPALLEGLGPLLRTDRLAGSDLLLQLGGPTQSIRGQVVDGDGSPCPKIKVVLTGGDSYGNVYTNIEDELSGRRGLGVATDSEGRFEYQGLYKPTYGLRAHDPETFLTASVEGIAPGTDDVVIVLSASDVLPRLAGQVVGRNGVGVAGAELKLTFTMFQDSRGGSSFTTFDLSETDQDGRFELYGVPYQNLGLRVSGQGVKDTTFEIDPEAATELELVVELRQRFQLDRARFDGFTRFDAVDAAGATVTIKEFSSGGTTWRSRVPLSHDANWPTFEVSDSAVELVFYKGTEEALRVPLVLERLQLTMVR